MLATCTVVKQVKYWLVNSRSVRNHHALPELSHFVANRVSQLYVGHRLFQLLDFYIHPAVRLKAVDVQESSQLSKVCGGKVT